MKRRLLLAVLASASIAIPLTVIPSAATADSIRPSSFERLEGAFSYTNFKPAALDPARQLKVLIQVTGTPVGDATADAEEAGKTVDKPSLRSALKKEQQSVEQKVETEGGKVLATYTDSFNGIAATIPVRSLPALQQAPGVVSVHPTRTFSRDNTAAVTYIGAPQAWQDLGKTGTGVKVAIIDTGLDYTHANFGGSGNPADFANNDGTVIEPGTFPTAKVIGGYDLVGDDYDGAIPTSLPKPDPDPLDCNGHGSHVAGSTAGFGVDTAGKTYTGSYDSTTHTKAFRIGPGVAPKASLMSYRVFGCEGSASEEVIVSAMERALKDGANVVNMSLGSSFGRVDEPSAQAVQTLTRAGVTVVASSGNSGANAYITGAPAVAPSAISVAAIDAARAQLPAAKISVDGVEIIAQNSNEAPLPSGTLPIAVLRTSYPSGPVSLGCAPADYAAYPGGVAGKLVITLRGTCARVKRAILGQQAGAAAVAMINTDAAYPALEGPITSDPDTGEAYTVTIPFLGIRSTDAAAAASLDGKSTALTALTLPNPGYAQLASFSSGGPSNGSSAVKPDVTAPGVAVVSTGVGTGSGPATISGTSMASPMVAGVAALVKEAHPRWKPGVIKAAIVSTADATSKIVGYTARVAGSGVVATRQAVGASVVAETKKDGGNLSFGLQKMTGAFSGSEDLTLRNTGSTSVTYDLAAAFNGQSYGAQVAVSPASVTVGPNSSRTVKVTLSLSAQAVAALPAAEESNFGTLTHIQGAVTATPKQAAEGVYPLRVAFLLVPDAQSQVYSTNPGKYTPGTGGLTTSIKVQNGGKHSGAADVYAWGITDADDVTGAEDSMDVRAAGVQSLPGAVLGGASTDRSLVFAVNTSGRWSNAAANEFDIPIDTNGDGALDYILVGADYGLVTTGDLDGRFASFVFKADGSLVDAWVATAPMNGGTLLMPVLASEIGLAEGSSRFTYSVTGISQVPEGLVDDTEAAAFDAFAPAITTGTYVPLAPGASSTIELTVDQAKLAATPAKGWLVVSLDNKVGDEADQLDFGRLPAAKP
ncbi:S8 family serine peptidase [Streptosporangium sp. 'caverna']|uniref:S8 family serine peptidase n=1 Tax=Streptosporangium sp. 'caverna' TaxID=2202249 RepID=UPI000D7D67D5|nr:S8 family serine peptidase [Streptosporangium sp. 'caverna']AWS41610.1 peptidase S8 and S53 subtilisin kexin sedolisin [Streptosporangium sp. 'caverna']